MFENSRHSHNMNTRPRFEKPFINAPRNPLNFWRRPSFPFLRRRMMSGRYPNVGFRHFAPTTYRPDSPIPYGISPNLRYPTPNAPTGIASSFVQRPSLLCMPCKVFDNTNNQSASPATTIMESQQDIESTDQKGEPSKPNSLSDLWVESLSPGGRIYYYNARTRESSWIKPINVRIIELNEIKQLTLRPEVEQAETLFKENPNQSVQQRPFNSTYINAFYSKGFPIPAGLTMFPPNVRNPPPNFLRPPLENIQKNIGSYNIRFMIPPPPVFPVAAVSCNLLPNSVIPSITQNTLPSHGTDEFNPNVTQNLLPNTEIGCVANSAQNLLSSNIVIDSKENAILNSLSCNKMDDHSSIPTHNLYGKDEMIEPNANISSVEMLSDEKQTVGDDKGVRFVFDRTEKTNMVKSEYNKSLSLSNSIEMNTSKNEDESIVQHRNEKLTGLKFKNSPTPNTKPEDSVMEESKCDYSLNLTNKDKPVDKSRPVSCTPIPGTCWCVVWTGDERVFFYDSERKVSVWKRPLVLLNRSDVDNMVKKSPLSLDLKSLTKEVRKTSADRSDMIKKLRKDDKKGENSDVKETRESLKMENIIAVEKIPEIKEKPNSDSIHHRKRVEMFCEMLSENKVSAFSTWEKEVHKIVHDPRYLLLPSEERRQVFMAYSKRKSQEETLKRQNEHQLKKQAFIELLIDAGVTSDSLFNDIAQRYSQDVRFKAIEKAALKESIFSQYVSKLEKKVQEKKMLENEQKGNIEELLCENNCFGQQESKIQNTLAGYESSILNSSKKESPFKEHIQETYTNITQKHINFSLKNRQEVVKQNLSIHLNNREEEQENHKYRSAVSNFRALLKDLIKDSDLHWQTANKILKADHRWNQLQDLGPGKREELFTEYISGLSRRKREEFHRFLDDLPDVTVKTSWLDIRGVVLKDPRCVRFSSSERKCDQEFKEYLRRKLSRAKMEYKQLLKETKLITHKSKSLLSCSNHLVDIEKALSQDKRYVNLGCIRGERKEILLSYINKLHSEEQPFPPMANYPAKSIK